MAADDFLRPKKLLARGEYLLHGRNDNPNGDARGDQGIENRVAGHSDQEAGSDRRQRHADVADIVDIGESDRRIVAARCEQEPGDAPIGGRGEKADCDRHRADDRRRVEQPLDRLPQQHCADENQADYLMEVRMERFGINAKADEAAYLFTYAEAVLLDRRTGREIWNINVHGRDRLTPYVQSTSPIPGSVITASTLGSVSVADFQGALNQLMDYSSNLITDELRAALRDVRNK